MTDPTRRVYPHAARFSANVGCAEHGIFGEFPCPWPDCPNGVPESTIYEAGFGPEPHDLEFRRVEWPFKGESGYSWNLVELPTVLYAGQAAASEVARRLPALIGNPGYLYHYTDVRGFMGIVRDGGLWLTDARYLNDRRELTHGIDIAKEVLTAAANDGAYGNSAGTVTDVLQRCGGVQQPRVCVACLSEDGDSLSQWRAYGSAGSRIALGVHPFIGRLRALNECRLRRVVYGAEAQRTWLEMLVHFHRVAADYDRVNPPVAKWRKGTSYADTNHSEIIYNNIYEIVTCFKDAAFRDEREWRFVYSENWPADMSKHLRKPISYRAQGRLVVPYATMTELSNQSERFPLVEVIVGPQAEDDLVARGIREFLASEGYDDVPVYTSLTPFRPDR